jgi:hypothetical protein
MPRPNANQLSNQQRAQRARRIVVAYRKAADTNVTDQPTLLTDLLTDLMHLAGSCRGVSFDRSLDMARSHYTEEFLRPFFSSEEKARAAFWQA